MKWSLAGILLFFLSFPCNSQIEYYEDVFHGGVCGIGVDNYALNDPIIITKHIESNSTIRKAYLFISTTKQIPFNFPTYRYIIFNGDSICVKFNESLNDCVAILNNYITQIHSIIVKDVTDRIHISTDDTIIPPQNQPVSLDDGAVIRTFYLLILYNNATLNKVGCKVILNEQNITGDMQYNVLLQADRTNNIGLAINSSDICDTIMDGSFVFVNNQSIGLIGGKDYSTQPDCNGVQGNFYYQNNTLFGMGNDTATPNMRGGDAIANIENYLTSNSVNARFQYQTQNSTFGSATNPIYELFFAYTPTCDTFSVTVPHDATVCQGTLLPLTASGGVKYEWLSPKGVSFNPAPGLSCHNCASPIFKADSSMFYTVRIWNNDSCSVVRPVHITVLPRPKMPELSISTTNCGTNNGKVVANMPPNAFGSISLISENNDTLQSNTNTLSSLDAGNYTFFYTDTNGCQSNDTALQVAVINNTVAAFSANPTTGGAPLTVTIQNQSQNATDFVWSVNGTTENEPFTSFTADTSGSYVVQLVAWEYDSKCADTATVTILVYDSLIASIPNVFTPNSDHINDWFTVSVNVPVKVEMNIVNRWGNEVFHYSGDLPVGSTNLWNGFSNGKRITPGVYFYDFHFTLINENCHNHCTQEKKGFVTVVE